MGFWDFLKRNELDEIDRLKKRLNSIEHIEQKVESEKKKLEDILNKVQNAKRELHQIECKILENEVGLYVYEYKFASSDLYKARLSDIKSLQKELIVADGATICKTSWHINNSFYKGKIFINKAKRQILRCFNSECDAIINKAKYDNIDRCRELINKSYNSLNKINSINDISITDEYLTLKLKELTLAYEYELKKHEEKESRRIERERMREEFKLRAEIEAKRMEIEKELIHYRNQIEKIQERKPKTNEDDLPFLLEREEEIRNRIEELNRELEEVDYRAANKKAGYVYIISNIGSFGENVYKIGMTRRLDPKDRIDELSSASVPFKFDVHAMIFCEDAPKLEAELHKEFEEYKVNAINSRKEFFKVDIEKIKEAVKSNYDKTVEFMDSPYSSQYLETLKIKAEH